MKKVIIAIVAIMASLIMGFGLMVALFGEVKETIVVTELESHVEYIEHDLTDEYYIEDGHIMCAVYMDGVRLMTLDCGSLEDLEIE